MGIQGGIEMINEVMKARFTVDGFDRSFEGFTFGGTWAGWHVPYFSKEVADEIVAMLTAKGDHLEYHEQIDAYTVTLAGASDEELYFSTVINGKKLYGLGNGSWAWELVDPTLEDFENHLHETVNELEILDVDTVIPDVNIEFNGMSISIPLNADLYEGLVELIREEIAYENGKK